MARLRIGIDGHVLTGKPQGSRTWIVNIVGCAAALHRDATYVIYSHDAAESARLISGPNVEHRQMARAPAALRLLIQWPLLMRRDRLDALVTQYIMPPLAPRARQIVVVHDILFETHPEFFRPWMRWRNRILTRFSARRARLVVTISAYSRDAIAAAYGLDPAEIALARSGVAPPAPGRPRPALVADGRPYLMMVGRLEPRKNLALALDAFARLPSGSCRLIVIGREDGEAPETLARLRATEGAIHADGIDDATLSGLYAHAAALVFPSRGEGWGIPVLESLGCGTPVIASSATAIPEAGGPCATYFDPAAPGAVARLADLMGQAVSGTLPFDAEAARAHVAKNGWDGGAAAFAEAIERRFARPSA